MKCYKVLPTVLLLSCFLLVNLCNAQGKEGKIVPEKKGKNHKVIRLVSHGQMVNMISSPEVTIEPGTTVIWINQSDVTIELKFQGKQVTMACKSPVHFVVDENGSFLSNRIPIGSVASLCFVEKGEFDYVARTALAFDQAYVKEVKEFKGKVIVK